MRKNCIDFISLGCSKNLVDSEHLIRQFAANGYKVTHNPTKITGEIAVVNTCGFIRDAQEESINTILELAEAKKQGKIKRLFVMGCLAERFLADLIEELPEVDKFYGKFNWKELLADLGKSYRDDLASDRVLTTPSHYAYIKISEGCNRFCAFCAIPLITGRHKSVPMDDILQEVRTLCSRGVKEFNVLAQDLSSYGIDLYGRQALPELIERMSDIEGVEWIRLHYAYPSQFPYDVLRVMRERDNVCKYLDIALQHINDNVLSNMRRHISKEETLRLIERIRKEVPGIHIRTTLMVGFPGEGEAEFEELKEFVREAQFERMGAFAYSEEEGTYAAQNFTDSIPEEVKQERLNELMEIQEEISLDVSERNLGKIIKVLLDRKDDGFYVGRTEFDSPEVDPEVLIPIEEGELELGKFYNVRINTVMPFEMIGEVVL